MYFLEGKILTIDVQDEVKMSEKGSAKVDSKGEGEHLELGLDETSNQLESHKQTRSKKNSKHSQTSRKDCTRSESDQGQGKRAVSEQKKKSEQLSLTLSQSLMRKLNGKAQAEGIAVDDLAAELIAEGLVLRAWEIMERKSAMRNSHVPSGSNGQGRYNFRSNSGQGTNRNRGQNKQNQNFGNGNNQVQNVNGGFGNSNNRKSNYKNIMDDSASFLEYVRNQEKKQR